MNFVSEVRSIREQIADLLRTDVLAGRLSAGERLTEVRLAERFGVGRGPVRDALLQLTQEGTLLYRPNCGVEVAPPNEIVRPLIVPVRRQIETFALRLTHARLIGPARTESARTESARTESARAESARTEPIRLWRECLDRLQAACARNDLPGVVEHDMAFHRWIVEQSGQPDLLALWLPVVMRMRLGYSRHADLLEVYPEHERIFEPFCRGDIEAAAAAVEANIV